MSASRRTQSSTTGDDALIALLAEAAEDAGHLSLAVGRLTGHARHRARCALAEAEQECDLLRGQLDEARRVA